MFRVNLNVMVEATGQLHKNFKQLNDCEEDLMRIRAALCDFYYMEDIIWQMNRQVRELEKEATGMLQLSRILDSVYNLYQRTDRKVENNCEDRNWRRRKEKTVWHDLGWIAEYMDWL